MDRVRGMLAAVVAAVAFATPAAARAADVSFGGSFGSAYSPASLHVAPGEQVRWLGNFEAHPLRPAKAGETWSYDGPDASFSHAFAEPGVYRFYCDIHGAKTGENAVSGMAGEVIVDAPSGGGGGGTTPPPGGEPPSSGSPPPSGEQPPTTGGEQPAPTGGGAPTASAPQLALTVPSVVRGALGRALAVRVRSSAPGTLSATLRAGSRTLGRATVRLAQAGERTIRVRLNPAGRAALRRARRITARLTVRVTDAAGGTATVTRTVRLRR